MVEGRGGDLYSKKALHRKGAGWSSGQPGVKGVPLFPTRKAKYSRVECARDGEEGVLCRRRAMEYGGAERRVCNICRPNGLELAAVIPSTTITTSTTRSLIIIPHPLLYKGAVCQPYAYL